MSTVGLGAEGIMRPAVAGWVVGCRYCTRKLDVGGGVHLSPYDLLKDNRTQG